MSWGLCFEVGVMGVWDISGRFLGMDGKGSGGEASLEHFFLLDL